jgi:hypothetical protein
MTIDVPEKDRRRHARAAPVARAELLLEGASSIPVDEVLDASAGGLLVACAAPPRLGTALIVRVRCDDGRTASARAHVVRVVWGGRDRGRPVRAGAALAFLDDHDARVAVLALLQA